MSREHQIERGPGGTTVVAGGKYTTHRSMAEEIVDFTLSQWMLDSKTHSEWVFPAQVGVSRTRDPINAAVTEEATQKCRTEQVEGGSIPEDLLSRHGAEAVAIVKLHQGYSKRGTLADPEGFPYLEAQLRYSIRTQMVVHLEDFYFRRTALFLARKDHGLPWAVGLSQVWAEERGLTSVQAQQELDRLKQEISARDHWT